MKNMLKTFVILSLSYVLFFSCAKTNDEYSDRNKPCVRQSGNRLSDTRKPVLAA